MRAKPAVLKQLRDVLSHLAGGMREKLKEAEGSKKIVEAACRQQVGQHASKPDRLMLLQKYASRMDRSIRQKLRELQ